jgi:hypothetical protein
VIVTVFALEVPALMLPNARLVGFAVSVRVDAVPVPLRAAEVGEFDPLLVKVTLPVRFPAVVGANTAVNDAVAPTAMVVGVASPLTL